MITLKERLLGVISHEVHMAYLARDTANDALDVALERNSTLRKQLDYALKERDELEKEIARLRAGAERRSNDVG